MEHNEVLETDQRGVEEEFWRQEVELRLEFRLEPAPEQPKGWTPTHYGGLSPAGTN